MKLSLAVLLLFLSQASWANDIKGTKFTSRRPGWSTPRLEAATEPLTVYTMSELNQCTINFISTNGRYITARHCIENCLEEQGIATSHFEFEFPIPRRKMTAQGARIESFNYLEVFSTPQLTRSKFKCEAFNPITEKYEYVTIEYLPQGGWLNHTEQTEFAFEYPEKYKEFLRKNYDAPSDFAVLKFENRNTADQCLRMADRWPANGERIRNTSFPSYYDKGRSRQFTTGAALELGEIPVIPLSKYNLKLYRTLDESIFELPKTFVSTSDASTGASGSAILSEQNEILGILHGLFVVFPEYEPGYMPPAGTVAAVSAKAIRDQIISDIGQKAFEEMFDCPAK